ncbi:MAG: hypothetical protein ACFBSE_01350 [Prochloraceae cyanobacterium]
MRISFDRVKLSAIEIFLSRDRGTLAVLKSSESILAKLQSREFINVNIFKGAILGKINKYSVFLRN